MIGSTHTVTILQEWSPLILRLVKSPEIISEENIPLENIPKVNIPLENIPLESTPEKKLQLLLDKMKDACKVLTPPHDEEVLRQLTNWQKQFFVKYKLNSSLNEERKKAAYPLSILCIEVVEFVIKNYAPKPEVKIFWFKYYNELKDQIVTVLPQGLTVDQFLNSYVQKKAKLRYLSEIPSVKGQFAKLEDTLFEKADLVNESIISDFESLKAELINVEEQSQRSIEQANDSLDLLTDKITKLFLGFDEQMKKLKSVGNTIALQGSILEQNLNALDKLIDK